MIVVIDNAEIQKLKFEREGKLCFPNSKQLISFVAEYLAEIFQTRVISWTKRLTRVSLMRYIVSKMSDDQHMLQKEFEKLLIAKEEASRKPRIVPSCDPTKIGAVEFCYETKLDTKENQEIYQKALDTINSALLPEEIFPLHVTYVIEWNRLEVKRVKNED